MSQSQRQLVVKKNWQACSNTPYQCVSIEVELNLALSKKEEEWVKIQLLYVRGTATNDKPTVGKKDWALFLPQI